MLGGQVVKALYALTSIILATTPTVASAFDITIGPVHVCDTCGGGVVGGTRINPDALNPASPVLNALPLPPQAKHLIDEFENGATNVESAVEHVGDDVITASVKAGGIRSQR